MTKLFAGVFVAALPAVALGGVTFTFDDPGSGGEFTYVAPDGLQGAGSMSFRSDVPVDLVVQEDSAPVGAAPLAAFSALFEANWVVDSIFTDAVSPIQSATLSGGFAWRDAETDELILSGEFTEAALIVFGSAGSIVASSDAGRGDLAYTVGQRLASVGVTSFGDDQDAVWTLTGVTTAGSDFPGGDSFFPSFIANAAFTGTTDIPSPGAMALLAIAGFMGIRRGR